MIEIIEILIENAGIKKIECLILFDKKICYLNNKKYEINDTFLQHIQNILLTWKNEYGSSNKIDQEEFLIKIKTNTSIEKIHGKGIYPDNYNQLFEILGELK